MKINGKEYNHSYAIADGDSIKIQFIGEKERQEIIQLYKFVIEHNNKIRTVYVYDVNDNEIILKQW